MQSVKQFTASWLVVLVVLALGFAALKHSHALKGRDSDSASHQTAPSPSAQPAPTFRNSVDLLISRCGRPDRDFDTGGFAPGPLVPARMVIYSKAHLRIAYIADDPVSQDPPYHWKFAGLVDTRTNRAIHLSDTQNTLQERLPCLFRGQR